MVRAQDILLQSLGGSHRILDQQMADVSADVATKMSPGSTIYSIGAIYAHTIFGEDNIVHGMLQGKPPLWASAGWEAKTGVQLPHSSRQDTEWASVKVDPAKLKDYAAAVKGATSAYIAGLTDAEMERKVQAGPSGEQTVAFVLTNILAWHVTEHSGEIAALKGVQGLKGLPF